MFYFFINAGSLIGTFMTPILREDVHCFGDDSCFSLAFGVPGVLMAVAVIIIVVGKPYYNMVPPTGSIMVKVFGSVFHALKNLVKGKNQSGGHWMDSARDKYGDEIVEDVKSLLRVLVMYIPIPVFWALYDQSGSRWTFQATGMDGTVGYSRIKPDQMQIVNPILVMVFIPLFDWVVYPFFAKFNLLKKPLQRMAVGGIITALSFFASGFLELRMQETYAKIPAEGFSNVHVMNSIPCMVSVQLHNGTGLVYEDTVSELHNHVIYNIEAGKYLLDIQVRDSCLENILSQTSGEVELETHGHKVSGVYLGVEDGAVVAKVLEQHEDPHKDGGGKGMVRIVGHSDSFWSQSLNLTLANDERFYTFFPIGQNPNGVLSSNYTKIDPNEYK